MAKRLIINADDFGKSQAVNAAVERAHKTGVVTSTTLMANMPAADDAVAITRRLPRLGVGVHLNLFESKPVSTDENVKCLLDKTGQFKYSPAMLALLTTFFHHIRKAVRIELAAQIQWLIDKGIEPTHIDSHKHIHACPPVFSIVCHLARQFKIHAVRWCYEPAMVTNNPWPLLTISRKKIAKLLRTASKINRRQGHDLIKTQALLGISHFGHIDTSYLKTVSLYNPYQATEIMTHPAVDDDSSIPDTASKPSPKTELEALCDERTKKYFRQADIELVHFGQL